MNLNDALSSIAGKHALSYRGFEVMMVRVPIVYAWLRGNDVQYVGSSTLGIQRIFDVAHERLVNLLADDEIRVWRVASGREARRLEASLIRALRPPLNVSEARIGASAPTYRDGIFRRGKSWYVEFQIDRQRYRKRIGRNIPFTLARQIAAQIRGEFSERHAKARAEALLR